MAIPVRAQLDAAVADVGMQVTRDNVLQARAALLGEADRLDDMLNLTRQTTSGIGLCGGDPVSADAAPAFDERVQLLHQSCSAYNQELRAAATALDATAKTYGYTEEEIAASYSTGH